MAGSNEVLRTCIVGCKRGLNVGKVVAPLAEFKIVGVCDLDEARLAEAAQTLGAKAYGDYAAMLREEKPDVVFVSTNTQPRAALVIAAAEAGVRGIIAEKPMAMSMGEARAMAAACKRHGVKIIVTHQRRMGGDLLEMRKRIEEGVLGDIELIRASCAGDMLTDGTHAVDSVRFLAGDSPVRWVLGQMYRFAPQPGVPVPAEFEGKTGFRYGHPVESATMSIVQFASGLRAEIFTGKAQPSGRPYQDYEIIGTAGRLRRPGDRSTLQVWDTQPGGWRDTEVRPELHRDNAMAEAWRAFARYLREGGEHPLDIESGLADHEVVMAVMESARLNRRIDLPLQQDAYPLQLMMDEGRA